MYVVLANEMSLFTLLFVIVSLVLVSLVIVLIVLFNLKGEASKSKLNQNYRKNYYHLIDIKSQKVIRYNFKDLAHPKEMSYTKFLSKFNELDINRFKNWINQIFEDENIDYEKLEYVNLFTIKESLSKSSYTKVAFQVKYIERKEGVIYLETVALYNIPVSISKSKKHINKSFKSKGEIKRNYEDGFFGRGYFLSLRLVRNDNFSSENDYKTGLIIIDAIHSVLSLSSAQYYIKDEKYMDLSIIDRQYVQQIELKRLSDLIIIKIKEIFELYGFFNMYEVLLFSSLVSDLPHSFVEMERLVNNELSRANEENNKIIFYTKNKQKDDDLAIKAEIIKICRGKQIEANFQPVIKYIDNEISNFGYLVSFKVYSNIFNDLLTLKKKALQLGIVQDVLGVMFNKALPHYFEKKETYYSKLFIPLSLFEISFALKIIPNITKKEGGYHLVCLFNISEFNDIEDYAPYLKQFKQLQVQGYEVGLLTKVNGFNLKKELYDASDIILVDGEFETGLKAESKSFIRAHAVFDRLYQFSKIVVAYELNNIVEIELLYKSGIQYFVGNAISEPSSEIEELDKKVIKKLINLNK